MGGWDGWWEVRPFLGRPDFGPKPWKYSVFFSQREATSARPKNGRSYPPIPSPMRRPLRNININKFCVLEGGRGRGKKEGDCSKTLFSGAKKGLTKTKNRTNSTKKIQNNSRVLPSKTRISRQIAPENSPESSENILSQIFFVVPFASLNLSFHGKFHDNKFGKKQGFA